MKFYKYFNNLKIYEIPSRRFLLNLYVGENKSHKTIHHFRSFVFWVVVANPIFMSTFKSQMSFSF